MVVAISTCTEGGPVMVTVSVSVNVEALIVGGGLVTVNVTGTVKVIISGIV